jgi:DNA-binding CsgD family transcriptional regulator
MLRESPQGEYPFAILDSGSARIMVNGEASYLSSELEIGDADVLLVTADSLSVESLDQDWTDYTDQSLLLLAADKSEIPSNFPDGLSSWGLLPLESTAEELVAALNALYEGLLVIAPAFAGIDLLNISRPESPGDLPVELLTGRELEVLRHLADGLANKQIAAALGISEHTVKFHISSIYSKFGVSNRAEAVRFGLSHGLVPL